MAANYILLERIELNASAASVTFSNIPQTGYTDLKLVISARTTRALETDAISLSFNGVATNQTSRYVEGTGASAGSSSLTSFRTQATGATATANTFGNSEFYIPNYTGNTFKSASSDGVSENNATAAYAWLVANLWSSTAAITSITVTDLNSADFVANSTFSLYGLAALGTTPVIAPKASGGNITTDGTYWYHAFRTSGTFTPQVALSADVLVVAGGGGGGGYAYGGGGGAGGLSYFASQGLTATSYTCVVGAGGTGGPNSTSVTATNGANSTFGALTASVGGGRGGQFSTYSSGVTGGSGGGSSNTGTGAAGTSGQGNAGGNGYNSAPYRGGGGGGASASGTSAGSSTVPVGGAGTSTYSSWGLATSTGQNSSGTYYYAGGGGGGGDSAGGTGGLGGGGNGGTTSTTAATRGTANTGGGGGGSDYAFTNVGGNGGSGIVIVRYLVA